MYSAPFYFICVFVIGFCQAYSALPYDCSALVKIDTIIPLRQDIWIANSRSILVDCGSTEGIIYYSHGAVNTTIYPVTITVYRYSVANKYLDSMHISLPDSVDYNQIRAMAITPQYAAFLWQYSVFLYRYSDNQYTLDNIVSFTKAYTDIGIRHDSLFLVNSMLTSRNMQAASHTHLGILDLRLDQPISEIDIPDPEGIAFSIFTPRKLIDFTPHTVLVSDATKYIIRLYDIHGKLVDSISRTPSAWVQIKDTYKKVSLIQQNNTFNTKHYMDELRPYVENSSMIGKCCFTSDSTILVSWGSWKKIYFDVWKKRENTWLLVHKDLSNIQVQKDEVFLRSGRFPLSEDFIGAGSFCISRHPIPISMYVPKTFSELYNDIEAYVSEHTMGYSLVIHRIVQ